MIRRATSDDLDGLTTVEHLAFGTGAWSRRSLASQLADPDSWIAVDTDAVNIQASMVLRVAADEAELLRVGVHPQHRCRGLARLLFAAGLAWLQDQGAVRLFLEVSSHNAPARDLYASLGFTGCGRRRDYYSPGEDALLLELALDAQEPS